MFLNLTASYYLLSQPAAKLSDVETDIKKTLRRLTDGESFVKYEKDVTLFVGKSGVGITTLLAHLTTDNSKLKVGRDGAKVTIEGQAISRTIFPTLVGSGVHHYYHCPGFTNSRNLVDDIGATYFIKKVVDQASRLRMVFVAEHHLFEADTCPGLVKQFSYMVTTIKNIGALRACMGMVVTKVPIDGQSDGQATIKRIGDKLVSYKPKLEEAFDKEPEKLQAVGELVDLLTETDEKHNYRRLAVFFEPPAPSSPSETLTLDKIQLLQDEKPKIELMVHGLSFVDRQTLSTNFRLASGSSEAVSTMADKICATLDTLMKSVAERLTAYMNSVVASKDDVYQVREDLQRNIEALKSLEIGLFEIDDAREFERNLSTYLPVFKIGAPQATLVEIFRQISYMQFLKEVSGVEVRFSLFERVRPLRRAIAEYEDELCWSEFVIGTLEFLSSCEVQKAKYLYNVIYVKDWATASITYVEITSENLSWFLDRIQECWGRFRDVASRLRNLTATPSRLAKLNDVLKLTLQQKPVLVSEPDTASESTKVEVLTCKGAYVRISDVRNELGGRTDFETLRIFATRGVFLDEDLVLSGKNIILLSPSLDLTDARKIDVSGESTTVDLGKAKDGYTVDEKHFPPADSSSGLPGKSAGNLVVGCINQKIGNNLTLIANGGDGGTGQHGGDGYPGNDGVDAPAKCGEGIDTFKDEWRGQDDFFVGCKKHYYVWAWPPEAGGNGGSGGDGGTGGNSGRVVVAGLRPSMTAAPGSGGRGGQPGEGGKGGEGRYDARVQLFSSIGIEDIWIAEEWIKNDDAASGNLGHPGREGSSGKLVKDIDQRLALEINAYKSFVFENYNQGPSRRDLTAFMRHINRANTFKELYDVYAFCDELVRYQESDSIVTLELYRGLMERIEEFLEPKRTFTDDEKKCLRYLYTATQTEICRLMSSNDKYLVINIKGYLEVALPTLEQLKTSRAAKIISDLRAKFGDEITRLVQEANDLINAHLPKEIDEAMAQMRKRVEAVLNEVTDIEKELEKDKAELEKLKIFSIAMFVLDILNSMAALLVFLGPIGVAMALGITVTIQATKKITEEIVKPDLDRPDHVTKVPEAVKKAKDYTSKAIKDEKKRIVSEADELKARIERMRKVLAPKQLEPRAFIVTLATDDQSSLSPAEADQELGQASQDLSSVNEQSTSSLTELSQTYTQAETRVDEVAKKAKFLGEKEATSGIKVVKEIGDHVDKFSSKSGKISKALAQIDERFKNLDAYKKKIRAETLPMIDELGKQMSQVQEQLVDQSQAALDIAKWNIGGCLSNMKFYLKGVTKGFEGEEEVGRTVMKVDAAITTMISIFDRIQNYQSQARMADHIADVAAVGFDTIDIADPKLHKLALKMRTNMQESLVLERYGACYSAFRQWAFPLAYRFLPTITLPDGFKNAADLSPSDDLKSMLDVVNRYSASIVPEDRMMERDEFDSDVGELPFYAWPNASFKASIANLLSGEEIRLMADIRNSPPGKDAIKFIRLGLKFRLGDQERSEKLHSLLNGFKLSLLHSGTSHYRVKQEFYTIQSASVEIRCKLRTKADGSPVGRNAVYDKLLTGDQMLSPYTLWTIKLIKNNPRVTYESLESFKDVDLELVGEGWSFDTAQSTVDFQLDKYGYQRADFPLSIC